MTQIFDRYKYLYKILQTQVMLFYKVIIITKIS